MLFRYFICLLLTGNAMLLYSQCTPWESQWGNTQPETITGIAPTADGGFVFTGSQTREISPYDKNILLGKADLNGVVQWSISLGSATDHDYGTYVRPAADGGFYVTAWWADSPVFATHLFKFTSSGAVSWSKAFPDWQFFGFDVLADGSLIFSGIDFTNAMESILLLKTEANGDVLWSRNFTRWNYTFDYGVDVSPLQDGGFMMLANAVRTFDAWDQDFMLIRTDSLGDTLWTRLYGKKGFLTEANETARALCVSPEGHFAFTGYTNDSAHFYLTDNMGNVLVHRSFFGNITAEPNEFSVTSDSGFVFAYEGKGATAGGLHLVKMDKAGTVEFNTILKKVQTLPCTVIQTTDGCFVTGGVMDTMNIDNFDLFLFKANENGSTVEFHNPQSEMLTEVYPNPADDVLHIRSILPVEEIRLVNALGQEFSAVSTGSGMDIQLSTAALAPGIWNLVLRARGLNTVHKVVVIH